jgi:hypothetical protein
VQCHRLAAEAWRRSGDLDLAVKHLEAATRLDPGDRESRVLLSLLRAEPGGSGEVTGLARVLRDDTFVNATFGAVCLEQGLAEEAALVFSRMLRHDAHDEERLEAALRARSRRKG